MGQKNSKLQITETDKAILQIKRSKDEIHKFTKRTDQLIGKERAMLKELIKENPSTYKQNAKVRFLLKRVHYQEHLVQQASDQLINLENMVSNIEFKLVEKQFIIGLQNGNSILTKLNKEFKNVDKLMDDVSDQIAYQDEINNVLATSIAGVCDFEDEIDKELDQMRLAMSPAKKESHHIEMPSIDKLQPLPLEEVRQPEEQDERDKAKTRPQKEAIMLPS